MALAAAQISTAIVDLIKGPTTTPAGERVYASRSWPLSETKLPAWRVIRQQEEVRPESAHYPAVQSHALIVDLQGNCRDVNDLDEQLDEMASTALSAVFATQSTATLGDRNVTVQLVRIDRELADEGEATFGRVTVSLQVQFFTRSDDPETII